MYVCICSKYHGSDQCLGVPLSETTGVPIATPVRDRGVVRKAVPTSAHSCRRSLTFTPTKSPDYKKVKSEVEVRYEPFFFSKTIHAVVAYMLV